ncbi:MAG: site-2 protease family protein [bacterium]|nr:site-2 protease family protein [bacterium]
MEFLISIFIFFFSVVIHEVSHGWVADRRGDPTARMAGRLSLNPLVHIDPIGSIILPLLLILSGSHFIFGWAKPVPVNFYNLYNPKKDMILVSLAGPLSNFALAFIASTLLRLGIVDFSSTSGSILVLAVVINLLLAVFNAVPIPPLDGSKILMGILPPESAYKYARLEPYGFIVLIGLIWLGLFHKVVLPIVLLLGAILLGEGF